MQLTFDDENVLRTNEFGKDAPDELFRGEAER